MKSAARIEYSEPTDEEIIDLYKRIKTIAVIGLSPKPMRPSHYVSKYMQDFGYEIIPVRPAISELLGQKVYPTLLDIPFEIDLVNIFRASKHVGKITDQCIYKKVKAIWMPEGVKDIESANKAYKANIFTVMDKCIYKEYKRLMT